MLFDNQLDKYIIDICNDDEFYDIEGFASLKEKMVKTKNNDTERVFQAGIYVWYIFLSNYHYFYKL
jgi:hypothetical protein